MLMGGARIFYPGWGIKGFNPNCGWGVFVSWKKHCFPVTVQEVSNKPKEKVGIFFRRSKAAKKIMSVKGDDVVLYIYVVLWGKKRLLKG